jgi:hypothetical protein
MDHASKADRIKQPANHYKRPKDILEDNELSFEEKKEALDTWEQDARQLVTASSEGMPGSHEGAQRDDHHRLGQVVRAKEKLGVGPTRKPSH